MNVKEIILNTEDKMNKTINSITRSFSEIRTGRAHPGLVEGIFVSYYGTPTLLKQMASISVPDAHLIVIQPWDISTIPEIEKAILKSNIGATPVNDGKLIRLPLPPLSKERREELAKVVRKMAEEGRVSLRTIRRDANEAIKKLERDKAISEDERFKAQEQIQKIIDRYIKKVDELLESKEKELMEF